MLLTDEAHFVKQINHSILGKDAVAALVTFLVSVVWGVELGLLTGAIFNLIYLIRPSVRPEIEVTQCKVTGIILILRDRNIRFMKKFGTRSQPLLGAMNSNSLPVQIF